MINLLYICFFLFFFVRLLKKEEALFFNNSSYHKIWDINNNCKAGEVKWIDWGWGKFRIR